MRQNPGIKDYLLWEGLPFLALLSAFLFFSIINWDYENKMIIPDSSAPDWVSIHMGQLLLAIAAGIAGLASLILFIVRLAGPKTTNGWYIFFSLTAVSIFLIFPSLCIVVLGPASIVMMEQSHSVPR